MNAFTSGGYGSALAKVETHRDAEARLLSRINNNLLCSMKHIADDYSAFVKALHENDQFWRQIATDLADDGNRLPEELRATLISLAGFVVGHSASVRRGSASIQPLVDLNKSIIRGLTRNGEKS
ncbi:flagellar biosynthesis regulator FlaF [Paracoccus aerodenitrificans]|uniref:flagellar biosynthesis regulator FlaF n=1 Tax=Paracoccus aerodenitrificans TaxID=3017781 RepID=UPI0022F10ED4|nr:flagellar biosynthesis regulator FlaF [Paracoccus aerodenitrificans]WBU64303.1 flagellar biosynthesis regulator FlaF [Paracoccus aerodenitrificans]